MSKRTHSRNRLLASAASALLASLLYAPMTQAIVPNDNNTPEDAVDNEGGVNGVGMFFRNDGFVCTGTLINPRTVLFAAHCVNNRPESDYGTSIRSAFSFNVDALPGFINWINNGFASNPDLNVFDINQIFWNPDSIANPASRGFIEGDIALASLATPASEIPTWALLFSALPAPDALTTASGTGYHVNITGYGRSGSGSTGNSQGIDWRRRAAENYIGALASLDQRDTFLFGGPSGLPQNVYQTDFDDPNGADFRDFNLFLDDALPNEGTTAGGDSGGPLILDAENNAITDRDIIVGVLSGGSGFFGTSSAYGTSSFYQPLYAFYDYIAANNPYRYVGANAGDGNWEDASHWVTNQDPNYFIFDDNGALVNGIPDTPETGINTTGGEFGAVCFQFPARAAGPNDCQDLSNGQPFTASDLDNGNGGGQQAALENAVGVLSADELDALGNFSINTQSQPEAVDLGTASSSNNSAAANGNAAQENAGGPVAPTLDNGRAGATNFVPNNIDPDIANGINARYFDVTLSADGTTTLSSDVTIDRLTISGANSGLNIAASGSLTSIMDIEQVNGSVNVDGSLTSFGDYLLLSGMLSGSGTLTTPFMTNVMGAIAPGGMGSIDTLAIDGSAVLASASNLLVDIGANGVNDVLAITGNSSLGGTVWFNPTADVRAGNTYTFLTTAGTQTGEFSSAQITTILRASLSHDANSVTATIEAGSYTDAINTGNAVQQSYANLLDGSRGDSKLAPIYATLDLTTPDQIQQVMDSLAPVTETTTQSLAKTNTETLSRFHRNRLGGFNDKDWGGKMTMIGNPVKMASNAEYMTVMSDDGNLEGSGSAKTMRNIPSDMAVYLSGAFIDGQAKPMPTAQNFADEDFDGWSVTGGIEHKVSDLISVGASLSYTKLDAAAPLGQTAESDHFAGSLYGQLRSENNLVLDGLLSLGSFGSKTSRTVAFPATTTLTTDDDSFAYTADVQVSKIFDAGGIIIAPHVGFQLANINFDDVTEQGGIPALTIQREDYKSTQGRIGMDVRTNSDSQFQARFTGDLVREIGDVNNSFNAGFAGAGNPSAPFLLFGSDKNWAEVGVGVSLNLEKARIDLSADTTLGRSDVEAQTYRAGATFEF